MNRTKWIYGVLIAFSVLLNLFFITRDATFYVRARKAVSEQAPCARLEPATQDALFKALGREHKAMGEKRAALRKAHGNVLKALRAEPFDEAVMTAAMGEIEGAITDGMHRFNATILELAKGLPREERRKLACVAKFKVLGGNMHGGRGGHGMPPFTKREFSGRGHGGMHMQRSPKMDARPSRRPMTDRMWMRFDDEILGPSAREDVRKKEAEK